MSTFGIFIETIGSVRKHPNADRLELAELQGIGYQFVIGKGSFKVGDRVLYFPIDATLPEPLLEKLGLLGKLSGKAKNRVKTIKLRGEISQGLVGSLDLIKGLAILPAGSGDEIDYAEALGVTKHEPNIRGAGGPNNGPGVKVRPLPEGVRKYDIENCERYKHIVEELLDQPVVVTEKLEGSHIAITRYPDGKTLLCSRNCLLGQFPRGEPSWWQRLLVRLHLREPEPANYGQHYYDGATNSELLITLDCIARRYPGQQVTLRGELLGPGVQGNIYGLTAMAVYLFEIELDGKPVDAVDFIALTHGMPTKIAPLLSRAHDTLRSFLNPRKLAETFVYDPKVGDGPSQLAPKVLREGIVIKPAHEQTHPRLGRLFLKQRGPEYLAASDD